MGSAFLSPRAGATPAYDSRVNKKMAHAIQAVGLLPGCLEAGAVDGFLQLGERDPAVVPELRHF